MAERSKILIVDDEPFNVDLLEQELEELGYETVSATNGQEALAQGSCRSARPDSARRDDADHGWIHSLPHPERE